MESELTSFPQQAIWERQAFANEALYGRGTKYAKIPSKNEEKSIIDSQGSGYNGSPLRDTLSSSCGTLKVPVIRFRAKMSTSGFSFAIRSGLKLPADSR